MNPLVSVVIPAYNAAKYIVTTIQSVLNQTYSNWELIVVNDGSTDDTEKIIKTTFKDVRLKYLLCENGGVSKARNIGIENAGGDYIAFLDADDVWLADNLSKKIGVLENSKCDIDWVYSNMYESDPYLENLKEAPGGSDTDVLNKLLLWEGEVIPGPSSNIILRKECFDLKIRFDHNISTAADLDFCIQVASKHKARHIPEPLVIYRLLDHSMSRNVSVMEHDCLYIYKKAYSQHLFHTFNFKQKCFANMYLILAGSWWVNGKNKKKGAFWIAKALLCYPPILKKMTLKYLNKWAENVR